MHNFVTTSKIIFNWIKAATVCACAHVAANQSNQKEASLFARGTHTGGIVVSTNVCLCRITLPSLPGRMLMQLLPVFRGPSVSLNWFPLEPKNHPRWATISNWVRWPGVTVLGELHWLTGAPLFFKVLTAALDVWLTHVRIMTGEPAGHTIKVLWRKKTALSKCVGGKFQRSFCAKKDR